MLEEFAWGKRSLQFFAVAEDNNSYTFVSLSHALSHCKPTHILGGLWPGFPMIIPQMDSEPTEPQRILPGLGLRPVSEGKLGPPPRYPETPPSPGALRDE